MYSRFHYILITLIIVSIYLIYLIGYYTLQQFQTSSFMESMQAANSRTLSRNREKEFLAVYIHTPAYQSQVAKATQNRKLPGEDVINIIRSDVIEGNRDINSATVIKEARNREDDPMRNMTNPQKWWYLLRTGI
ncbi:hypothetical protein H7170_02620 [Candidatus Gracilibacteria bacterium]|nr:hypothetical protein [Candidatus Gracilibacteria bacterium]